MQTTVKHDAGDLIVYVGLGESRGVLLYPAWLFEKLTSKAAPALGLFPVQRGTALHLGLFGVQWLRKKTPIPESDPLPGFVEPNHPPQTTTAFG